MEWLGRGLGLGIRTSIVTVTQCFDEYLSEEEGEVSVAIRRQS